jgi:DNA-binding NarL/FixJ family response regulator
MHPLRTAVLDDHPAIHVGVRSILERTTDLRYAGGAADEYGLWPLLHRVRPDVVLLDLHHSGRDGLTLTRLLTGRPVAPRVVLHTAVRSDELTVAALLAGATASVGKHESARTLVNAIRAAGRPDARPSEVGAATRRRALSDFEDTDRAIIAMRLDGAPVGSIADVLRLHPTRVERRISRALGRLTDRVGGRSRPGREARREPDDRLPGTGEASRPVGRDGGRPRVPRPAVARQA